MKIQSPTIKPDEKISEEHVFNGFGCNGKNISPQLSWSGAPKNTKSFALTMFDPDAPTGSGWWHWLLVNIPAHYSELPLNFGGEDKPCLKDEIIQVRNDFGTYKFGGPCPPEGHKMHRYVITLHALNTDELDIAEDSTAAAASFLINQHTIEKTELTGLYGK